MACTERSDECHLTTLSMTLRGMQHTSMRPAARPILSMPTHISPVHSGARVPALGKQVDDSGWARPSG